jgi:serine phosphatase RsbU (regulator of sigma subunit)
LATAFVARFEPADRRLTWAQAGHPPALLARAAVPAPPTAPTAPATPTTSAVPAVRQLDRPTGMLLGAVRHARYGNATAVLDPGDLLLMYTDGLVESPRTSLEDGLTALTTTLTESLGAPGDPLVTVIRRLRRTNPDDDTCILAAQLTA